MAALPNYSNPFVGELRDALARNKQVVFHHAATQTADGAANTVYQDGVATPELVKQFAALFQMYARGEDSERIGDAFVRYAAAAHLHFANTLYDHASEGGRVTFDITKPGGRA